MFDVSEVLLIIWLRKWMFMWIQFKINFIWTEPRLYFYITFYVKVCHKLSHASFTESFTIRFGFFNKVCWSSFFFVSAMPKHIPGKSSNELSFIEVVLFSNSIYSLVTIRVGIIVFIKSFKNLFDKLRSPWHIWAILSQNLIKYILKSVDNCAFYMQSMVS